MFSGYGFSLDCNGLDIPLVTNRSLLDSHAPSVFYDYNDSIFTLARTGFTVEYVWGDFWNHIKDNPVKIQRIASDLLTTIQEYVKENVDIEDEDFYGENEWNGFDYLGVYKQYFMPYGDKRYTLDFTLEYQGDIITAFSNIVLNSEGVHIETTLKNSGMVLMPIETFFTANKTMPLSL